MKRDLVPFPPRPFRRLPDLDPKARRCVAAIALLMLAACGGADDAERPTMTIDPPACGASGVCT